MEKKWRGKHGMEKKNEETEMNEKTEKNEMSEEK